MDESVHLLMEKRSFHEKLTDPAHPAAVILVGTLILVALFAMPKWLNNAISDELQFQRGLSRALEQTVAAREHVASIEALKTADLERLKVGISGHALSQKSLFESGLSLQEERRLLEKQLEIITTTLFINPALQRIFLMRAEQPLQSYLLSYIPLRSFGGAPVTLPSTVRIVSKERFAYPERGKSEQVNGALQYTPPQVGTSVRSKALGEFVIFTNSALIIHGPPLNEEDHAKFPHVCLGLDREAARKLYRASFIGTKISLSRVTIEKVEPAETPLIQGTTETLPQ
jgi:hypothetical protein